MARKSKQIQTDGFDEVLNHIETLPDINSKQAYLIEEKTRWKLANTDVLDWKMPGQLDFSDKCDLEIQKYKQLAELERKSNASKSAREIRHERELRSSLSDIASEMRKQRFYANNSGIEPISQFPKDTPEPAEADRPNQFTRKQVIYLLQELIPEFKTADNTRKAEFITKLTGYTSTKSMADEFSNIRNFADPTLLAEWKERLKTSGRGRKRNNP